MFLLLLFQITMMNFNILNGSSFNISYLDLLISSIKLPRYSSNESLFNISNSNLSFDKFFKNKLWNRKEISEPDIDPKYAACVSMDSEDEALMISHQVYLFTAMLFVVIGLIGNGLSIMVFSSKVMRVVSSNVYLLFLAVSDSLYLFSVFFTKILTTLRCLYFIDATFDFINQFVVPCKILQYMLDLFADYSTCLILAFTVERYIACYHPIQFKEICTLRRARIVCGTLLGVVCIFIAPYHFLYMGHYADYKFCTVLPHTEKIFTILYLTEAVVFRVFPVFLIAVLNIFIIVKVIQMNRAKMRRTSRKKECRRQRSIKEDKHRQLTIMLILVSTSYILAYLPVLVHFVIWKLRRSNLVSISESVMDITQNYAKPMYIFGFAINFFLYTMSGRVFREQLVGMICGKKGLRCSERATENTALNQHPLTTVNNAKTAEQQPLNQKEVEAKQQQEKLNGKDGNQNGEAATLV